MNQSAPIQLISRLVAHVPQAHCDLERNSAYYAVSLDVCNRLTTELRGVKIEVLGVEKQVIALTRRLEIAVLEPRQSQTVYIEFYSYLEARIVPKITIKIGQNEFQFESVLLI